MKETRKRYSKEFKQKAVVMSDLRGNVREISDELAISVELSYQNRYTDREDAALSLYEWIETWYNRNTRHSELRNLTICEFEKLGTLKSAA
jgi:transposase InsO family protein